MLASVNDDFRPFSESTRALASMRRPSSHTEKPDDNRSNRHSAKRSSVVADAIRYLMIESVSVGIPAGRPSGILSSRCDVDAWTSAVANMVVSDVSG
jgi:hypothetical protein